MVDLNFMPRTAFLTLLHNKMKGISSMPIKFTDKVWDYLEEVVVAVLKRHSEHYHQLQTCTKREGQNLIAKMKVNSMKYLMEVVEKEKLTDYPCNAEYMRLHIKDLEDELRIWSSAFSATSSLSIHIWT